MTAGLRSDRVLHGLRRSFGDAHAAAGVPMRTLQEWMALRRRDHAAVR